MLVYDLLIVGGGPSGLSAAINGASEGLSVLILDQAMALGGQAKESAAIENFPGFPDGITGEKLTAAMVQQAYKFGCGTSVPSQAIRLSSHEDQNYHRVFDDNGDYYDAKTVLLSNGLSYRRHSASGLGQFMGRGCYYGAGPRPSEKCEIAVVGGANSAGQAVLALARNQRATVKLLVRKTLNAQMSTYLIDRIRATPNIEVCENCELLETRGRSRLETTVIRLEGKTMEIPTDYLFIYIGAVPRTWWLQMTKIELDSRGFILTDRDLPTWHAVANNSLPFETSLPGVFAAGDVRANSVKRIASAVGEGAQALQMIHKRLTL